MRPFAVLAAAAFAAGLPQAVSAQAYAGSGELIRGDFAGAERVLAAEHRLSPDNSEVMLNLAVVYAQTGRAADARALYQGVLARPDEDMTLANGAFASSHQLASDALRRLASQAVAIR